MKAAEKAHLAAVVELGCIVCTMRGFPNTPAEIHHLRDGMGAGQRNDNYHVIPLCAIHHRTGPHGTAFHAGDKTWQAEFGTESELLERVTAMLK